MNTLKELAKLIRYNIVTSTTKAGSGHPTSSLSAVELMTVLWFDGYLKMDLKDPKALTNDRIIFSKGHAAPLLYSLYAAAGYISREELDSLRKFTSVIEGHPTPRFEPIEVATGSLGQGLSAGMGMALGFKKLYKNEKGRIPHVYVLMGDSEIAEGQIWEAARLASYYSLDNLVGIVDVNRLGQRGETMDAWDVDTIGARFAAFGWDVLLVDDGHDIPTIQDAFKMVAKGNKEKRPMMIIAHTKKGNGISLLSDLDNWHGKPLPEDKLEEALSEIGPVKEDMVGTIAQPEIKLPSIKHEHSESEISFAFNKGDKIATREAYGSVIEALASFDRHVLALDAETSNSTFAETVKKTHPDQFVEMYIAEQNMVTAALGLDKLGFTPFVSSFAAFFSRAYDQIRMVQYSEGNLRVVASHAGVSIGQDGSSQMALEDLAMMRGLLNSVVFYPSDAVSTAKLAVAMYNQQGISYLRLTREKTPVLYDMEEEFVVGGSKVVFEGKKDKAVIVAAGITLHEAIKAYNLLKEKGTEIAVVDAYSVKPLDEKTIVRLAKKTGHVVIVEDHYPHGGLGEAVKNALAEHMSGEKYKVTHLAVTKNPRSGTPAELLEYEEIDASAIIKAIK